MQQVLVSQQSSVSEAITTIPPPLRATPRAIDLAQQIFDTSELLELILLSLDDTESLLQANSVSRQFHVTITGSLQLQRRLGLQPDLESELCFVAAGLMLWWALASGPHASPNSRQAPLGSSKVTSAFSIHFQLSGTVTAGTRCRSMLFFQPPLREISRITPHCCESRANSARKFVVKPESIGITVGDVIDIMQKLKTKHRLGPHARAWQLDEDGFVNPTVTFAVKLTTI
jgi:hypothetical protein